MPINLEKLYTGTDLAQFRALSDAQRAEVQTRIEDQAQELIRPAVGLLLVVERVLTLLQDSDILPELAKIQRRYYLELQAAGFSREEAFTLSNAFLQQLSQLNKKA